MNILQTQQLLRNAATLYQAERVTFSKQEILHRLNQLKQIASQKKIPKLTLRRDILSLEDQLQRLVALEQKLARQKNEESIKVATLKQQIQYLKKKLATLENPRLTQQVEHLSHLVGETLAQEEVEQEAAVLEQQPSSFQSEAEMIERVRLMQQRLIALRHELDLHRQLQQSPEKITLLEKQVHLVEEKLQQILVRYDYPELGTGSSPGSKLSSKVLPPPPQPERQEVKHRMLVGKPLGGKSMAEAMKLKPPQPKREG